MLNGPPIVAVRILLEWEVTVRFEGPYVSARPYNGVLIRVGWVVDDLLDAGFDVLVGPPHVWDTLTVLVEEILWVHDHARMRL